MNKYPVIEDHDHCNQFSTRKDAVQYAEMESGRLHLKHLVSKTITWRGLEPKTCYTIITTRERV